MKVLLTGATSMIGRHIVDRLLERGDEVTVIQRGASNHPGVREIRCDIADSSSDSRASGLQTLLAKAMNGQEAVVHLAAKVGVSGRWAAYESVNVHGVRRLIETAQRSGVSRFVQVSTPSVAHAGKSLVGAPAGAASPTQVRGHYAQSKALGEQIALAANSDDMHVVALRPHLVWGPGDKQLVQRIVQRARAGRLVLVGSGLALIDTTYVSNAASAIVAGMDNAECAAGQALVISNGQPRTVRETLQRMLLAAGLPTELRSVPAPLAIAAGSVIERVWDALDKPGDPPMTRFLAEQLATAHWFDQQKTRELLNWRPSVSIEEGFESLTESLSH